MFSLLQISNILHCSEYPDEPATYKVVRFQYPASVRAIVCSKWAHHLPSTVTTVQLSAKVRTYRLP